METRPNHTVYINNLNEKVKKEGEFITSAPKYQMFMTRFIYQIWVDMMSFNLPACRSHQRTPFRRTPGTSSSWPDTWQSRVKPRTFVWIVKGIVGRLMMRKVKIPFTLPYFFMKFLTWSAPAKTSSSSLVLRTHLTCWNYGSSQILYEETFIYFIFHFPI